MLQTSETYLFLLALLRFLFALPLSIIQNSGLVVMTEEEVRGFEYWENADFVQLNQS
jgi:hypothetical protein